MNELYFQVERPGVHTTFQDLGRFNVQHIGISPGGAMDYNLLKLSNKLVNNTIEEGVVEFAYQGPRLKLVSGKAKIVIAGNVHFIIERNGISSHLIENFNTFETYILEEGDIIDILATKKSIYGYLSIQGGFKLKKYYNSISTLTRAYIGSNNGKKIQENQKIFFNNNLIDKKKRKIFIKNNNTDHTIRVVKGPQFDYFAQNSINEFFTYPFTISNNTDRMGMRLEGNKIENIKSFNIPSEGIIRGSIQVTGDGNPIVLMADHPTIGGYPKIASVISTDFPKLSQLSPGKIIYFKKVEIFEAEKAFYTNENNLERLFNQIETN